MFDVIFNAPPGNILAAVLAGIFGLLTGSFLNVVIHRVPKMMQREWDNYVATESDKPEPHADKYNLMVPRSACPQCGHKITAVENIPVISYLALRGKCSSCREPISIRYPIIEFITGMLSAFLIWHFGSGIAGLSTLLFVYFLIAMTFIDADTQLLPDDLTLPLMWCGLLINVQGVFVSLGEAVIGAAAGYMCLWLINFLFEIIRKKQGMGHGDFKLLAALGAWLGWKMLPVIVLMSSLVGAVVGIVLIVLARRGREIPIPFGPYLAAAGLVSLVYGRPIAQAMMGFS